MSQDGQLPEGWTMTTLGAVTTPSKERVDPAHVPCARYIGLEHIEANSMRLIGEGVASDVTSTKSVFHAGDVLYGKLRPYLNKITRPSFDGICSTDILVFTQRDNLDSGFLAYFLNQASFVEAAHHGSAGVELPRASWKDLANIPFPLPPLDQQRLIAALIGQIKAKQQTTTEQLGTARHAIERFRQAVLAAACSGRLSENWRAAHPEVASVAGALELKQRTQRRKGASDEPPPLNLPDLPESYIMATIGDAAELVEYGTSQRAEANAEGVPVLRMGNIQDGQLDVRDLKYIRKDREIERLLLREGDLLFNRTNSPELVGKSAVYHRAEEMTFASYLIRVRFAQAIAKPDFANYWINSAWGRAWAYQVKTDGVSQSNINGTKLSAMPLPLPPIEEQAEIVRRASAMLTLADSLLAQINTASQQVQRSAQAVLAKAFRGELAVVAE